MARQQKKGRSAGKASRGGSRTGRAQPQGDVNRTGFALRDDVVEEALISGSHRDLLEDYFGEEAYAELRELAARSRRVRVRGGPRVLILPGIMGSKLGRPGRFFDDTLWIDPVDISAGRLAGLALDGGDDDVGPLGVVLMTYLKIKLRLRLAGFDAVFHPYDWRHSIVRSGAGLADRIRREAQSATGTRRLYLVAHSMGGLVSRAALKLLNESDERESVARLVMLGTPNYGSFSPVQALSGYHSLVRKVAALDLRHDESELVNEVFSTFTGLYQMLPAPDRFTGMDLYHLENWPPTGMAPRRPLLEAAPDIHGHLAPNDPRFVLIAGVNQGTVVGVHRHGDGFVFTQSTEGDGTVPLALARLDGVTTYFVEEEHGSLPNNAEVAGAVIDLLETGETRVLGTEWEPRRREIWETAGERLAPAPFEGRTGTQVHRNELRHLLDGFAAPPTPARGADPTAGGYERAGLSSAPIVVGRKRQGRIDIRLAHGDITQVDTRAIVLGLFKGVRPAGAAIAVDRQLDGAVWEFTERRMLTGTVGEVFMMPASRYRTGADIIVFAGLGTYEELSQETLRLAGENVARTLIRTKVDEFATVMIGSGSGLSPEEVLEHLVRGFVRGVQDADSRSWLRAVTFCERDLSRFNRMHHEMLRLSASPLFDETEVTVEAYELPPAPPLAAAERRFPTGRSPVYLMVREEPDRGAVPADVGLTVGFVLRASLLTAGEKATVVTDSVEVEAEALNRHLEVIETKAFQAEGLESFGATLSELVLPPLVRQALGSLRDRHLVVINDSRTSRIPWESINVDGWFPAAAMGLSRKYEAENLAVAKWLEERRLESELAVLLIVNPTLDLPGAVREGELVREVLASQPGVRVDELAGEEATYTAIRAALRSGRYDVVHYAGHAFFDPIDRARSGILCHGRTVLSGNDLARLERLPALMFFNACESGRVRGASPRVRSQGDRDRGAGTAGRIETSAGFAETLLRAGVANYVGTYWPVEDASATTFGAAFYENLVTGASVGAAVNAGRGAVKELRSVDWADYILYGSPDFAIKRV